MSGPSLALLCIVLVALLLGVALLRSRQRRRRLERARTLLLPSAPEPATAAGLAAASPLVRLGKPAPTRHPILLAHGWFGFERIGMPQLGHDYFRGVRGRLEALGHRVHVARVSPIGSIGLRATQLARQVELLGPRVNIIAHSMGGLDARLAIARHGLGPRVASLTTIGTPHQGTPLADMALALGDFRRLRRLLDTVGLNVDGLYDVSTLRMREFNRLVLDSPEVAYGSVVCAVNLSTLGVHAMLSPSHSYLLRKAGPNDGVVPALSQLWGEALGEVDADHWAQIGWSGGFDVHGFYARLAERLAERGF
ncbi:MAG: Protein of unknown function hydrolase domain protein [Myxococcaceae bacterium]|nr:Protein of unknown function hydrolase domain protein [Myxococcaceae bacterium]